MAHSPRPKQSSTPSHTYPWPLFGSLPPQPVSLPAPTLSPSFRVAQAITRAKIFPYKYPILSIPVILHTYSSMKMEQCSETSALKLQTSVNNPEESVHPFIYSVKSVVVPDSKRLTEDLHRTGGRKL
jgi:hypothetical protein